MRYTISQPDVLQETMPLNPDPEKHQPEPDPISKSPSDKDVGIHDNVSATISWDNDADNPKNWPSHRKWVVTILVSSFSFNTMMTSTMLAPSLSQISKDLNITRDAETQLVLSVYVLSYAFGPFLWSPLSELYGRTIILHVSSTWFLIWNIVCGFAQNEAAMIAGRVLSGAGAAAAFSVSSGLLGDCWRPEERGKSLSLYTFIPLLGPTIGPIIGGVISQHSTWRWSFWSTSAFDAFLQLLAFLILCETHSPTILHAREKQARKANGNTLTEDPKFNFRLLRHKLTQALQRPYRLLFTQPILQLLIIYSSTSFGILYILLSTLPSIFTHQYHQTPTTIGLNYISFGIGFAIGAQSLAFTTDIMYKRQKTTLTTVEPKPELRIKLLLPASILAALGLLTFGTTISQRTHWIVPNLGIVLFAAGTQFCTQCINAYITDIYGPLHWTASAMAGNFGVKSIAGFGFPLFAPAVFGSLGYGWSCAIFATALVAVGGPVGLGLVWWGEGMRGRGERRLEAMR